MIDLEIGISIIAVVFFAFGWAASSLWNRPKFSTARIYPLPRGYQPDPKTNEDGRGVGISGNARVGENGVIENVDLHSVSLTDTPACLQASVEVLDELLEDCSDAIPEPPKGRTIKEHHNPNKSIKRPGMRRIAEGWKP